MVKRLTNEKKLILLIVSALLIQLIGRYYSKTFVIWGSFDSLKFILACILPLILGRWFIFSSFQEMGLGWPRLKAKEWALWVGVVVLLPFVISEINRHEDYLQYYSLYRQPQISLEDRWIRFAIFSVSTIVGWEVLHRGFLLFGIRRILEALKISVSGANLFAILWVMSMEVTYHFIKPDLEAWGILIFSPMASIITLRARSVWPALFLHLWIEAVFILNVTGLGS